jgi:hypothetical protein
MDVPFNMQKHIRFIFTLMILLVVSGCITRPIVLNKMQMQNNEVKHPQKVLLILDKQLLSQKHQEKQLGATFVYDLGFYLKNAVHDSLTAVFENIAQSESESLELQGHFDLVIKPVLVSFSAPVPALVLMHTKTQVEIKYEITPKAPFKPYLLSAVGTYELLNEEDEKMYKSLTSKTIYTYNPSLYMGMHVPDYSYEAGKDAYMAIYHALNDLNSQLLKRLEN